jgi:hypothetical protein
MSRKGAREQFVKRIEQPEGNGCATVPVQGTKPARRLKEHPARRSKQPRENGWVCMTGGTIVEMMNCLGLRIRPL